MHGRLLATCSPTEARAFFYHSHPRLFAFSTMPKGLFAHPLIPREIDRKALAAILSRNPESIAPESTFYSGVRRLLSGQLLSVSQDGLEVQTAWQPDLDREIRFVRDEDYVAAFDELFTRAVNDRLRTLSPVGVMMSGGMDSTSVAAVAASHLRARGERLTAFTHVPGPGIHDKAVPPARYADETPYVQAMADLYENLDLCLVENRRFFLDDIIPTFNACEWPIRNAFNIAWIKEIHARANSRDIRVLLTGGQGNLTISWGGDGLLSDLLQEKKWGKAFREARSMARLGLTASPFRELLVHGVFPLLPMQLKRRLIRGLRRTPDPLDAICRPAFAREYGIAFPNNSQRHHRLAAGASMELRLRRWKVIRGGSHAMGSLIAGYQALFGVEERDPTTDRRIVEFCLSIPESQFMRDGRPRWLIHRAMADRLPPEILNNRRRGLQAADWLERSMEAVGMIQYELAALENIELARQCLELKELQGVVRKITQAYGAGQVNADLTAYRPSLERGLMMGRFLRWFATGA